MYKQTDRIIMGLIHFIIFLAVIATLYPFIYTLSMSISSEDAVLSGKLWLLPHGFSLKSYGLVFQNSGIWISYYNTIWYTVVGTIINLIMTTLAAYPLSKHDFYFKNVFLVMMVVTMYFSGGMIPSYLLVQNLGLYDTRWAIVLPGAISVFNVIIMREFFKAIPKELEESACMDGANPFKILLKIYLPLSKPVFAVLGLFYMVDQWNSFFPALIYLSKADLQPLQLYLKRVLIENSNDMVDAMTVTKERSAYAIQLKYSLIMVTILPIICVYPFLQKHFVKGLLIGSIKG